MGSEPIISRFTVGGFNQLSYGYPLVHSLLFNVAIILGSATLVKSFSTKLFYTPIKNSNH